MWGKGPQKSPPGITNLLIGALDPTNWFGNIVGPVSPPGVLVIDQDVFVPFVLFVAKIFWMFPKI